MVWLKKTILNQKHGALWVQLGFQEKYFFGDIVYFHSEMLGANNVGLVQDDCLVNAIIFIQKICCPG